MQKWHKPDERWSIFGINSFEEYLDKYLIKGKFHSAVPEDVLKNYETIEYLMAHAYYHWPMYDEAWKKLMNTVEMAIKLRCIQEGMPLQFKNKKGKEVEIRLADLITKLGNFFPSYFIELLNSCRNIRNIFAHPDKHSYVGGIAQQFIIPIVNILNQLFLSGNWYNKRLSDLEKIKTSFIGLKEGPFVLHFVDKPFLISSAHPIANLYINDEWLHLWKFDPVLINTYRSLSNHKYPEAIYLVLSNESLNDNNFKAFDLSLNKNITIERTEKTENIIKLNNYKDELAKLSEDQIELFRLHQRNIDIKKTEKFIYDVAWK